MRRRFPLIAILLMPLALAAFSQELPVASVALFSSGVAYFELRGQIAGDTTVNLPFTSAEIDDALKSLVVRDFAGAKDSPPKGGTSPTVSYPSLEPLDQALQDLGIDLSGSPKVADILRKMKGAELAVEAPDAIVGRIVSVEDRPTGFQGQSRTSVILLTDKGLRAVALDDIATLRFTDPALMADFQRGLSLILGARFADRRNLEVRLPGAGPREAAIGYIVAAPVWKASYRLDLSGSSPWLQAWAIVDNPGGIDWKNVRLSLVSGRPISFIQNLYAPLMLDRPVLPLSIAGTAEARTYDSGLGGSLFAESAAAGASAERMAPSAAPPAPMAKSAAPAPAQAPRASAFDLSGGGAPAAIASPAGDQFQFTIATPVSLEKGRSAMLPIVSGSVTAEKVSIYTADSGEANPMLGVRLTNSLGMKLPAGPITVFDGGSYAGDALMEFLPEKDKRLIVYGQDLSVTVEDSRASARETTGVRVAKGVLTFSRRITWTRTYDIRNAAATARKIVVEHPIMQGAELIAPGSFEEKTDSVYRFGVPVATAASAKLEVKERLPASERIVVSGLGRDAYLSYASSGEIPQAIRDAFKKAADLAANLDAAKKSLADLVSRRADLVSEQGRIRDNLDAVGKDSTQGQQYLKRLMDSESGLDDLATKTTAARKAVQDAQAALDSYIAGLDLGS